MIKKKNVSKSREIEQGNKDNLAITTTFFIEGCGDEFFTKYFKTDRKYSEIFTLVLIYIR